jgi:hypothetical protein
LTLESESKRKSWWSVGSKFKRSSVSG